MSFTSIVLAALPSVIFKSTLLLLVALAATVLMRHASAAARHLVLLTALVGVLGLPALEAVVPAWNVLPAIPSLQLTHARSAPDEAETAEATGAAVALPAARIDAPEAAVEVAPSGALAPRRSERTPVDAAPVLLAIWLALSTLLLVRLTYGVIRIRWIERRAEEVTDEAWLQLADRLTRRLGLGRTVRLLRGPDAAVPMTWGTLRPVVLLPEDAERWSDERRLVVLAHELAHVRRWDALTQWVPHLAVALFWFHPLVWVAATRLRAEREHACDDAVLEIGTRPTAYADHLLALVRSLGAAQGPATTLAMARRSQFEGRLLAILDSAVRRGGVSRGAALVTGALATLAILPLAALRAAEPEERTVAGEAFAAAGPARPIDQGNVTRASDPGTADLSGMVATARSITSESARADFLVMVTEKAALISREGVRWRGPSPYAQVARAAAEITSPAARRRVLVAIVERPGVNSEGLLAVVDATRGMPAADTREVLTAFADHGLLEQAVVRRAWLAALERLPAGSDLAETLGALVQGPRRDTLPRRRVGISGAAGEIAEGGQTMVSGGSAADGWTTRMRLSEGNLSYDPERPGEGHMLIRGREITVQTNDRTARILIDDGGFVTMEEKGGVDHRLEIRGGTRRYTVNGDPRAWDAAARAWEARYLERLRANLLRRSGASGRRETPSTDAAARRWDTDVELEGSHHGEPSYSLTVRARDVELAADASKVVAIRPGGTVAIDHTLHPGFPDADPLRAQGSRATLTRSLRGRPAANGAVRWRYTVNGAERPFDSEGRAWLAGILRKL